MDSYPEEAREENRRQLQIARALRKADRSLHEKELVMWTSAIRALESDRESDRGVVRNEEAWRLYVEAERRELRLRQEGHLAKLLGRPLPGESPEELRLLAEEDRLRAEEGLVELLDESGRITHRHIDELAPEDRSARIRAEGSLTEWIVWRQGRRSPPRPTPPA